MLPQGIIRMFLDLPDQALAPAFGQFALHTPLYCGSYMPHRLELFHVALDTAQANHEQSGYRGFGLALLPTLDNSFTQIKRVGFHHTSLTSFLSCFSYS